MAKAAAASTTSGPLPESRFRLLLQVLDAFDRVPDDRKPEAMEFARRLGKPAEGRAS